MKHVNRREFLATTIPLPPLAEQKRIAGILDAADALRAKRQEALAQLDTLRQSTFLDMFGDPVTNPMGWDRKPLTEALELINGRAKAASGRATGCRSFVFRTSKDRRNFSTGLKERTTQSTL